MRYFCCNERRRNAVIAHGLLNGIDFLEVLDDPGFSDDERQRTLLVHFLKPLAAGALNAGNVRIDGGERIRGIHVTSVSAGTGEEGHVLRVDVDRPGDFSPYVLRLVIGVDSNDPPEGIDPRLASVEFSFKAECPSDMDCRPRRVCPPEDAAEPDINFLARDYASFRRLMLDRLSMLAPQWQERAVPDVGITLVELLAFVGDYLSYQQDAVATEAYLGTARRRVSVRRHARLVDYFVHDGCNARAWVRLQSDNDGVLVVEGTQLCTGVAGAPTRIAPPPSKSYELALQQPAVFFETMQPVQLYADHNQLSFYTWGDRECCLPRGATCATLRGARHYLKAGDVLILAEVRDPGTGTEEDADPGKRHPVRLKHVSVSEDPAGGRFLDPPGDSAVPVTKIEWASEDALPFPLCISAVTSEGEFVDDVSVAWGNIVLADHGRKLVGISLGTVPEPRLYRNAVSHDHDACHREAPKPVPARYQPRLPETPVTQSVPLPDESVFSMPLGADDEATLDGHVAPEAVEQALLKRGIVLDRSRLSVQGGHRHWSLSDGRQAWTLHINGAELILSRVTRRSAEMRRQRTDEALPQVQLTSVLDGVEQSWSARRDLLGSFARDPHFVVEVESDGAALVRFGDGDGTGSGRGRRPEQGSRFSATCRIGNGRAGNVGADSIVHIVTADSRITSVGNPLPGSGGTEAESVEEVRQRAPFAFRHQERAVTSSDYSEVAERDPQIQRAAATIRWTGSWHTVFVTADRLGGLEVDEEFENDLRERLERYRMAGYDLEVDGPQFVPLEIEMFVCVKPDFFRGHVREALLEVFSNRDLPDGRRGVFHPDNFTFGRTVYLGPLYAAAQAVPGVQSAQVTAFQRQRRPDPTSLADGRLELNRLEIARLDNDPNYPERGVFRLTLGGGK